MLQVVKLEAAAGSSTPTSAQNGAASAAPVKQEPEVDSKVDAKPGTPHGTSAQMDAGKFMYATKVGRASTD